MLTPSLVDARNHGLRTFSVYQGQWSAAERDFERDILPMARDEGMALAPWGVLGGGKCKHILLLPSFEAIALVAELTIRSRSHHRSQTGR